MQALDRLGVLSDLSKLEDIQDAIGRIESRQLRGTNGPLAEHEFRVHSQAGEDGIIDFLIRRVPVPTDSFVEFGVQDYRESNTRFLLVNSRWRGLVIDGDPENVRRIQADPLYWRTGLTATQAWITRENVNDVIRSAGMSGDIGLLSVDIDGNDYWVFDAIDVVRPAIAVVEYNHRFGPDRSVTIPYEPGFVRRPTDASWLCCGASLSAIDAAARRKGLTFVGCSSFGNNAFFVRTDLIPKDFPRPSIAEGFVSGRFRESVIRGGAEVYLSPAEEAEVIENSVTVDVA